MKNYNVKSSCQEFLYLSHCSFRWEIYNNWKGTIIYWGKMYISVLTQRGKGILTIQASIINCFFFQIQINQCVINIYGNSMTTNTSNSTNNDTSHEDWMPVPASQCIPWLVVFSTECLAIVILNIITIIVFVKRRQLQRRSTYLIINLAIVDFAVGAVTGPLFIEDQMRSICHLWDYNEDDNTWVYVVKDILLSFPVSSLVNLAVISLERVHATFRPYKHRFIKKWVYGVIITVFWIMTAGMLAVMKQLSFTLSIISISNFLICSIAYRFIPLFVIVVSYVSIFIKVRYSRHPQRHGAASQRERKLTSTLFLVTLVSLLTWLPLVITWCLLLFEVHLNISFQSSFHVGVTLQVLYFANSLINPIIYALRMPELRAGLSQLFRRNPNRQSNPVDLPLQNLYLNLNN